MGETEITKPKYISAGIPQIQDRKTDVVVSGLHKKGATFFTFAQLERLRRRLGPKTKITTVQKMAKMKK